MTSNDRFYLQLGENQMDCVFLLKILVLGLHVTVHYIFVIQYTDEINKEIHR